MKKLDYNQLDLLLLKASIEKLTFRYKSSKECTSTETFIGNYDVDAGSCSVRLGLANIGLSEVENIKQINYALFDEKIEVSISGNTSLEFEILIPDYELVDTIL